MPRLVSRTLVAFAVISIAGLAHPAEGTAALVIVQDGQPRATIVVADEPDAIISWVKQGAFKANLTTQYAAEQLQLYLAKVTGAKLPIVKESQAPTGQTLILLGRSGFNEQRGVTPDGLDPEGFIIRTDPGSISIVGEIGPEGNWQAGIDRGTLWGVYEFLERVCGIRWYFAGEDDLGIVIPKQQTITVPPMTLVKAPAYQYRTGAVPSSGIDWFPVARPGNSTGFWANHTHGLPWAKAFGAEHPEYFALRRDGTRMMDPEDTSCHTNHLCYTEPGVLAQEIKNIAEYDKTGRSVWMDSYTRPTAWYVKFCPQDTEVVRHCTCPRCQALWRPYEGVGGQDAKLSEIVFGYAARLANAVGERWPGRRVGANAYAGFLNVPRTVEIPDNLDVMYCMFWGSTLQKEPEFWEQERKRISEWVELLGHDRSRFYIWEYFYYPNRFGEAPMFSPHVMWRFYRENQPHVKGAFNNGLGIRYGNKSKLTWLIAYLWHRVLWDPSQDVDELLAEFYQKMFGPAEKPMKEFFTLIIDRWEGTDWVGRAPGWGYGVTKGQLYYETYPREVIERLIALLERAKMMATEGSIYARRVQWYADAHSDFFAEAKKSQKW